MNEHIFKEYTPQGANLYPGLYVLFRGVTDGGEHKQSPYIGPLTNIQVLSDKSLLMYLKYDEDVIANGVSRSMAIPIGSNETYWFRDKQYTTYSVIEVDPIESGYNNTGVDFYDKLRILGMTRHSIDGLKNSIGEIRTVLNGMPSEDMDALRTLFVGEKMCDMITLVGRNMHAPLFDKHKPSVD